MNNPPHCFGVVKIMFVNCTWEIQVLYWMCDVTIRIQTMRRHNAGVCSYNCNNIETASSATMLGRFKWHVLPRFINIMIQIVNMKNM